jgi:hypothetical protein
MKCLLFILTMTVSAYAQVTNDHTSNNAGNQNPMNITDLHKDLRIKLVIAGSSTTSLVTTCKVEDVLAQEIIYNNNKSPSDEYHLIIIKNHRSQKIYIVPASANFYISDSSGITGCWLMTGGEFGGIKSYFETAETNEGASHVIARFKSELSEDDLNQKIEKGQKEMSFRVLLRDAAPMPFFTAHSLGGSQPGQAVIKAIDVSDGIVRLDLLSDGGKFSGTFWIDLKAKKLIQSIVEGQEMDLSTGKPFAIPLHK